MSSPISARSCGSDKTLIAMLDRAFAAHAGSDRVIDLQDLKRALGIRSDYLARRMLENFDIDADGVIGRDEFIQGVQRLVFGAERDKLLFAFRLNDHDRDGFIDRIELMRMIGISLSEADTYRASQPPSQLAAALFALADRDRDERISFEEFEALMRRRPDLLQKMTRSEAIWIAPNEELIAWLDDPTSHRKRETERELAPIIVLVAWVVANVGVFAGSLWLARSGANAAYEVGRAFGRCIDLNGALILVPMMRRLLTRVRSSFLGRAIPVDDAIAFHRIVGHTLFALAGAHAVAFGVAYATGHRGLLFWHLFATNKGITGTALLGVFAVMWFFALSFIRRSRHFELFYFTHLAYLVWLGLAIAHAPTFLYVAGLPLLGFVVEQLLRLRRRGPPSAVVTAEPLRSGVTHLEVGKPQGFEASPGDYVFLRIPQIAKREWHPFTISSAPERDVLAFHIRSLGNWTSTLRRRVESSDEPMVAYVDGPYGTPSAAIFESRHAVLIGAGIGVTPFASVLESLVLRAYGSSRRASKLQKVHFFWLNKDQFSFEWFTALLSELEDMDKREMLDVHLCMTSGRSGATALGLELAREVMHEAGRRDLVTGLKRTHTHMGPPDWETMLGAIAKQHAPARVDVFFCGPHGLGRKIRPICAKIGMTFREEKF